MKMTSGENLTINDSPIINSPLTSSPLLSAPVSAPLTSSPSNVRYSSGLYHNGVKYEWGKAPAPITTAGIYWSESLGIISLSSNGTDWITIADKNLGATAVGGYGKFFQWGNNSDTVISGSTSGTAVDASTYGPSNYYNSNTFITANPWDNSGNLDLRGDVTNTNEARRGPCDEGWHVPSKAEADILYNTMTAWGLTTKSQFSQYLKLTLDGYYDTNRGVHGVGSRVMYWTSTRSGDNAYEIYMYGTIPSVVPEGISQGLVIRPFKNNAVAPDETWTILYQPS